MKRSVSINRTRASVGSATVQHQITPRGATRERIHAIAEDLYVLRGHDGFSFGHIAEEVGTTRANIHHHFRDKRQLMGELIERFVTDAILRIESNWTQPGASFTARLAAQIDDLHHFYTRFNPHPGDRNVWSPLSRLRLDLPALGDLASDALMRVDAAYDISLRQAVSEAVASGELLPDTPVDDVARLLRASLLSCAPMTQDSGDFAEVQKFFGTIERMILAAWASRIPPDKSASATRRAARSSTRRQ
jgi:AcrR family transcriptional regulator